jgi:hypothetical protein
MFKSVPNAPWKPSHDLTAAEGWRLSPPHSRESDKERLLKGQTIVGPIWPTFLLQDLPFCYDPSEAHDPSGGGKR